MLRAGLPDYSSIDRLPQSIILTSAIRKLLVAEVGKDTDKRPWRDFDGLMTSVRRVACTAVCAVHAHAPTACVPIQRCSSDMTSVLRREVNDMPGTAKDVQERAQRVFAGILPAVGAQPHAKKLTRPRSLSLARLRLLYPLRDTIPGPHFAPCL